MARFALISPSLQVPVVGTWPHHSISIMVRKSFGELAVWGQIQAGQDNKGRLLGFLVMQLYGSMAGFLCGSSVTTDCSCCPCDMSLGIDLDGPKSEMKS